MKAWLLLALAGCSDQGRCEDIDCHSVDATTPDVAVDTAPGCEVPSLDQSWLAPSLQSWVNDLAASPRATNTQRDAARTYIANQLTGMGWTAQTQQYATGANVYATIPATSGSEKQIVIGAHFDTVAGSPGANDNASGVAVVLAVARYLKDTPCRRAPVIVAFFDEEESGLFGARAFATMLNASQTRAVHTIDQVAWDSDGDNHFEIESPTATLSTEWHAAATVIGVVAADTSTQGTDHEAFRARGFAAVGLTEEYVGGDTSPYRHTSSDTPATIDADYIARAAKLAARVVIGEMAL